MPPLPFPASRSRQLRRLRGSSGVVREARPAGTMTAERSDSNRATPHLWESARFTSKSRSAKARTFRISIRPFCFAEWYWCLPLGLDATRNLCKTLSKPRVGTSRKFCEIFECQRAAGYTVRLQCPLKNVIKPIGRSSGADPTGLGHLAQPC